MIFANNSSNKGLISKIYKELIQLNTKQTIPLKNGQRTWTDTSPSKTYKQPTHMRRCSTSLAVREMQIKTTMRFHLMLVRMTIINKTGNKCWRGCGKKATLIHCWWGYKLLQPLWKTVWRFPRILGIELPYDPAILLLCVYLKISKCLLAKIYAPLCPLQHYLWWPKHGSNLSALR